MNIGIESVIQHFSVESEQAVIGALLQDNDAYDRIYGLQPEHFYRYDHRLIFSHIIKLIARSSAADVITVFESLRSAAKADECGGLIYLNEISQSTPSSANIIRYAGIVREKANRRALIALGHGLAEAAETSLDDAETLIDKATSKLESISQGDEKDGPILAKDGLTELIEEIDAAYQGNALPILSTGFVDLDKRLGGGMNGGELIIIAGRPSMGKTALALNIANHVAKDSVALVLSQEMPAKQLNRRSLSSIGKVPLQHLKQPQLMLDSDWQGLTFAVQKLSDMALFIDDQAGLRLMDIRAKAKAIKRKHGLKLIVIDYLQLCSGDKESDNRNTQIEVLTRGLKVLAKELDCTIIALSQLSREVEKRPNKRPMMSDLRDSGAIEQDADVILFIYRDEVYNPDSPDRGTAEIICGKLRDGELGVVRLTYFGDTIRFVDNLAWRPLPPKEERKKGNGLAAHI